MSSPLFSDAVLLSFTPEVAQAMDALCNMEFGEESTCFEIQLSLEDIAQSMLLSAPDLVAQLLNIEHNQEA